MGVTLRPKVGRVIMVKNASRKSSVSNVNPPTELSPDLPIYSPLGVESFRRSGLNSPRGLVEEGCRNPGGAIFVDDAKHRLKFEQNCKMGVFRIAQELKFTIESSVVR